MAKQAQRNYGADTSLVRGEAAMRQAGGFQPLMQAFDAPMQRLQQAARERQAREQQRNNKVESYLSALNASIDVTALTETDQKAVNEYLMGVKDEYAEAASAIVGLKPGTPEYMEQLDIMNGVKNSLANLKGELDGYQESKANYLDSFKDQSAGNNSLQSDNAASIFTGETPFSIGTGGHLFFKGQDGTNMAYKDVKMPFKKDYQTALKYNDLFTPIYNSGSYDATKQKIFEDRIRAMMSSNPDGMKSIIADQLSSFGNYEDLIPLLDDPANLETVTNAFVQRASEAARAAAAEGKAKKEADSKTDVYKPRIARVKENAYKGPDGTVYKITTLSNNQKIIEDDFGNVYKGETSKLTPIGDSGTSTSDATPTTDAQEEYTRKRNQMILDGRKSGLDEAQIEQDLKDAGLYELKIK